MNVVSTVLTYTMFLPILFGCGGGDVFTDTVALAVSVELSVNYIVGNVSDQWNDIDAGVNGQVRVLAASDAGELFAGGSFTELGGTITCNAIGRWNSEDGWAGYATYPDSGEVHAIFIDANGLPIVGGTFETIDSATIKYIAHWDGAAWQPLGSGAGSGTAAPGVNTIVQDPLTGNIYLGGNFNNIGGVTMYFVGKWDGSTLSAVGTASGFNGPCYKLLFGSDGWLYAVGNFTTTAGATVTLNRFARFKPGVSAEWEAVDATGLNGAVWDIVQSPSGRYYLGGQFTQAGGSSHNYMAIWNGNAFLPMAGGANGIVYAVQAVSDSEVYVSGIFSALNGRIITDRLGIWNGTDFLPVALDLPGTPVANDIIYRDGNLYLAFSTQGTAVTSETTTVNHAGTTRAFPTITVTRSGGTTATLESIQNLTTGKVLLFDHPMLDGERIVIDLTPGNKTITTYVGDSTNNALNDLLPGSDFGTFALAPGVNDIGVYISATGGPTVTAFIQWQTTYPTIDGAP